MPANTQPIFPLTPRVLSGKLLTSNAAKDGTGTVVTVFTAGANASRIDKIQVRALGTNVATVLRLFINNGNDPTVATNNMLVYEKTIAATTLSEVAELADVVLDVMRGSVTEAAIPYLPAGHKINITIGTTVAAGLQVTVYGGDY